MTLETAVQQFLQRFEAVDDINDKALVCLQREMIAALERRENDNTRLRGLLQVYRKENAQLRERLQSLESSAAIAEAMNSYTLDDDLAAAFIGGMGALTEARR